MTDKSLPGILRQIAVEIRAHSIVHNPPLCSSNPGAFRDARARVVALASQADELASQIKSDTPRKAIKLLAMELRELYTGTGGLTERADDEWILNRPQFEAAVNDGVVDDLYHLSDIATVEIADSSINGEELLSQAEFASIAKMNPGSVSRLELPLTLSLARAKAAERRAANAKASGILGGQVKAAKVHAAKKKPSGILSWKCNKCSKTFADHDEKCHECGGGLEPTTMY